MQKLISIQELKELKYKKITSTLWSKKDGIKTHYFFKCGFCGKLFDSTATIKNKELTDKCFWCNVENVKRLW